VIGPSDQPCGTILWESKRAKNFSESWLAKLREDQRKAGADVALIVTSALPRGVQNFDHIDGIWVTGARCGIPVAIALRQSLINISAARQASDGQQTKMELVYQYLTGRASVTGSKPSWRSSSRCNPTSNGAARDDAPVGQARAADPRRD
jgi:hypothetical protein